MPIREILTFPNPLLHRAADPVSHIDAEIRTLMDDMLKTMYHARGIGLAAVQIGVHLRIAVMDLAGRDEKPRPRYFVNPELSDFSDEINTHEEGCLSVPNPQSSDEQHPISIYEPVQRPARCRVRFLDYNGEPQQLDCDGLLATCIQHEVDHLNGILFLRHLSRLKRSMIEKKLRKAHIQVQRNLA